MHMRADDRWQDYVVVDDPRGEWRDGSLVKRSTAAVLASRGLALLPLTPGLLHAGCGGYVKRAWGSGVPLDFGTPRLTCPISIFGTALARHLRWAMRLVAGAEVLERIRLGQPFEGTVHVSADTSQRGCLVAGVRQVEPPMNARALGPADEEGGWTLEGAAECALADAGVYGLGVFGAMPGVRVAWLAVALCEDP
jgi:hypothetical protein